MPDPITILDPISLISDPITMISEPNKSWYLTQLVWYLAQSHNAIFYHFWPYHNDIWWNNNHIWPSQTDIWPSYQGPYHMDISAFFHYWVFYHIVISDLASTHLQLHPVGHWEFSLNQSRIWVVWPPCPHFKQNMEFPTKTGLDITDHIKRKKL